jgi:hypothetical protein
MLVWVFCLDSGSCAGYDSGVSDGINLYNFISKLYDFIQFL